MKLLFERSRPGRGNDLLPPCDVPVTQFDPSLLRGAPLRLPEIAEVDLGRHYTELAKQTHGVNDGFYPLGSCTMKYNPRVNEEAAAQPGFTQLHPLQPVETVQGALEVLATAERLLCEITGMDGMSFQPAAGAHGEYTGLLLIRKYHQSRGDAARTKILVPDAAHGTNPASATMAGFQVVSIPSNQAGGVDLDALRQAVGPDTAGLMLTNPNTVGLFDANILEITQIVHDAGGLCYYDGANLNAVMGQVRSFYGNFLVVVKALSYLLTLGKEGIPAASAGAVLNANYLMKQLMDHYDMSYNTRCMHEFVMTLQGLAHDTGVTAMDVAKRLLDFGIHPPTMYFPLIVHEALMVEPTETESPETLDQAAQVFLDILAEAKADPESLHQAPRCCPVGRPDEVTAARSPILRYSFGE